MPFPQGRRATTAELQEFGECLQMHGYVLFRLGGLGVRLGLLVAGNCSEKAEFHTRVREESQVLVLLARLVAQGERGAL